MMAMSNAHPTYSREQLARYVSLLYECEPERGQSKLRELEESIQRDALEALTNLQQRHLAAIPFGNVVIHYSQHHTISLDPDRLFHELVERGLGGYCFENNGLFAIVLRTLGYKIYTAAAKVSKEMEGGPRTGEFFAWTHMVTMVIIGGDKYMVDVGFGPQNATRPLVLKDGQTFSAIGSGQTRLVIDNIPTYEDTSQRLWLYQFRPNAGDEWRTAFAFTELEFSREDYDVMNYGTSQMLTSHFVSGFIVSKFLLNDAKDDIVGCLSLPKNVIKQNLRGETEILQTLETEAQRVEALATHFNIHLLPMEVRGIKSRPSELK